MTRSRWLMIIPLVVIAALLAGNVIATHNFLTAPHPGHNDFLSRWDAARLYWKQGVNPYSDQATLDIQTMIYGRPVQAGEDPGFFAYPFYTVFVVWPLVYVDYAWASAIWMVLLEVCLVGGLILAMQIYNWRPRPWIGGLLLLWTLIFYYAARGLFLGQPGLLVYFLEALTIWGLVKDHDRLAGAALAISTIKPQMGYVIVPALLLWGVWRKRWQFVAAFGAVFGVLFIASFLLEPSWLGDWIHQVSNYTSYTAIGSPVEVLFKDDLRLGDIGVLLVNVALYGWVIWAWFDVLWRKHEERFLWAVMWTLTITHLVALRTATPHFVVFIPMIVFYLRVLNTRRGGDLWVALALLALIVLPWVQFAATVQGKFEHSSVYLPLPFGSLLLLWFTRRWWWKAKTALPPKPAQAVSVESLKAA